MIVVADIGLLPASPDAAEGFYGLVAAATAYLHLRRSGCAEIGRV